MSTALAAWTFSVPVPGSPVPVTVCLDEAPGPPRPGLDDAEALAARTLAPHRCAEFTRGRRLLRATAAVALGVDPTHVVVDGPPGSRPVLAEGAVGGSVSHTDGHTAAAVWPGGPVGVDVTEPSDVDDALLRRCCHLRTAEVLAADRTDRAAAFARIWAVQEACSKALGRGLASAFWRIPVDPAASRGRWRHLHWQLLHHDDRRTLAVAVALPLSTAPPVSPFRPPSSLRSLP